MHRRRVVGGQNAEWPAWAFTDRPLEHAVVIVTVGAAHACVDVHTQARAMPVRSTHQAAPRRTTPHRTTVAGGGVEAIDGRHHRELGPPAGARA